MFKLKDGVAIDDGKYTRADNPDYFRYAEGVTESAINNLARLFRYNRYAKDIIAGWRYGYKPEAVARYILNRATNYCNLSFGMNGYQEHAVKLLRNLLKVDGDGWGVDYGYTPSLDELDTPAAVVQADINKRLAGIRKLAVENNENLCNTIPYLLFNDPIENAGVIHHENEAPVVVAFTEAVFDSVRQQISHVFTEVTSH